MVTLGYTLSSEEQEPQRLVDLAVRAEDTGFEFAMISDHFHPWVPRQGQSPFVWAVLGGIARATSRLRVGTGVTCPTMRIHPAIIAQAAATTAALFEGRFFLGVGAGENLNEHILGDSWPEPQERLEMLEEAIEVIRLLWQGGTQTHHGCYYTVDQARLYSLPATPPPLLMAAGGKRAARIAAHRADGFIGVEPDRALLDVFTGAGGAEKPRYGQVTVCYAKSEEAGRRTVHEWWPVAGLPQGLFWEVKTPELFAQAVELVREGDLTSVTCGPDPAAHLQVIHAYADAGYDHVWVHQIGPEQDAFLDFYRREILPELAA